MATVTPPSPELPEGYYEENFEIVLATIEQRYRDLLRADELAFFGDWAGLSLAARRLYVRLISRKGPHFRRDRIRYQEIPDLDTAFHELIVTGFLDQAEDAPSAELLSLLLRGELQDLARGILPEDVRPSGAARKDTILDALVEHLEGDELEAEIRRRVDIVRPLRQDPVIVFRLLFFGNLSQDWTEFVLRDLGLLRFEPYDLRTELRLFPTREALDDTLALRLCHHEISTLFWTGGDLEVAVDLADTVLRKSPSAAPRRDDWHPVARRHFDRICNKLGRELERAAVKDEGAREALCRRALAYYEEALAPPSRERRARVLALLDRLDEALDLCREIEADPHDETEVVFAPRFSEKLQRQRGDEIARRRRVQRPAVAMEVEKQDGVSVESLALKALAAAGQPGFFAENWLWRSLFGLVFWDIVFAPIEGAFLHPFQYGPLDLSSPDFRKTRAELIEKRLLEIRTDHNPAPALLALYDEKYDTANRLVAWGEELRSRLEMALQPLTGELMARIFDRLSRDIHRYRRGFPDLFVLSDASPGFELLEVKGPGDQLRPEQGAWIDYLNANGIPARVLKVSWS